MGTRFSSSPSILFSIVDGHFLAVIAGLDPLPTNQWCVAGPGTSPSGGPHSWMTHPRPDTDLARYGSRWIKLHRYWFAWHPGPPADDHQYLR